METSKVLLVLFVALVSLAPGGSDSKETPCVSESEKQSRVEIPPSTQDLPAILKMVQDQKPSGESHESKSPLPKLPLTEDVKRTGISNNLVVLEAKFFSGIKLKLMKTKRVDANGKPVKERMWVYVPGKARMLQDSRNRPDHSEGGNMYVSAFKLLMQNGVEVIDLESPEQQKILESEYRGPEPLTYSRPLIYVGKKTIAVERHRIEAAESLHMPIAVELTGVKSIQ